MARFALRLLPYLAVATLLLMGCQPIQPQVEVVAPAAIPTPTDSAAQEFPIAGLSLSVPAGWTYGFDPTQPYLILTSPEPEGAPRQPVAPFIYLFDEPVVRLTLVNTEFVGAEPNMPDLLQKRFVVCGTFSLCTLYFGDTPTVVEAPTPIEINGVPAVRAVMAGADYQTETPFTAYVYAIHSGDRVVYASAAFGEDAPAALLPAIEGALQTLSITTPAPLKEQVGETVNVGEILAGTVAQGEMTPPAPDRITRQAWSFDAEAGNSYEVRVSPAAPGVDPMVDIVNAEGKSVVGGERNTVNPVDTESVSFIPRASGKYSVLVRTFYGQPGPYTVDLHLLE